MSRTLHRNANTVESSRTEDRKERKMRRLLARIGRGWLITLAITAVFTGGAALGPVVAHATGTLVSLVDQATGTPANVSPAGRLLTRVCDEEECALVDKGNLMVGDGLGDLTVDGRVTALDPPRTPYHLGLSGRRDEPIVDWEIRTSPMSQVPVDKRLVIEYLDAEAHWNGDCNVNGFTIHGSSGASLRLPQPPPDVRHSDFPRFRSTSSAGPVRLVLAPGERFGITAHLGHYDCHFFALAANVNGYLEDV
jgi:hypothetical protein